MTTQQQVTALMNTMVEYNCSLLESQIRLTRDFTDQIETATALIRTAFERDGKLTTRTEV